MAENEQNRPRSHEVTDGNTRAPARAMLRAIGMTDADFPKAQVGVAKPAESRQSPSTDKQPNEARS